MSCTICKLNFECWMQEFSEGDAGSIIMKILHDHCVGDVMLAVLSERSGAPPDSASRLAITQNVATETLALASDLPTLLPSCPKPAAVQSPHEPLLEVGVLPAYRLMPSGDC